MLQNLGSISLKNYNTFGLDVKAREVLRISDVKDLSEIKDPKQYFILGGGSNVLFTGDLNKGVILNETRGIAIFAEDEEYITLKVASGENWHQFVMYCVDHNYGGIENLSLIPGSVGAAPMQNIGAYGVEVKDVITKVEAYHLVNGELESFNNEDCEFGYRESVFKRKLKDKYFIAYVYFRLKKKDHHINTSYGAIAEVLNSKEIENPSIKDVSDAVIEIRRSKLPDPKEIGNSGSFFKNPVIPKLHFNKLAEQFPDIKSYPVDETHVKVPAGWLIESLGWKGKRVGNTGSHAKQALVLVNYGDASGEEIRKLSEEIKASVRSTYNIELETEVNIIS